MTIATLLGISAAGIAVVLLVLFVRRAAAQAPSLVERAKLLDLAYDAILIWELKTGAISYWNGGSEGLYGWERSEVLGRTPQAILQTQFPKPLAEINAELVTTQRWEGELIHHRRDGSTVVVNSRWALHVDADGRPSAVLAINRDITERKRADDALAHLASHDGLTGLPNRGLLQDRLERAVATAHGGGESLALLLLDLDRFKEINDRLGHHAGDELLQQVAARLAEALPAADLVARLGGDEFAVLVPDARLEDAICVAERLLQAIKAPLVIDGHTVAIGASIGITTWRPPDTDASTLLHQADVAMYVAKRAGRGYAVYAPEQDQHSRDRLLQVTELRRAIQTGALRLHFQPIASLASHTLAHVEALVRWDHPTRGLLPPGAFVPLAEQTGLVVALDRWVLGAALEQCRAWSDEGHSVPVAINLSAHSLHDPDLPEHVASELTRTGVPARSLLLELTETTVMVDPERAARTLRGLRERGIRIAIDDFGMGNAGFNICARYPPTSSRSTAGSCATWSAIRPTRRLSAPWSTSPTALGWTSSPKGSRTRSSGPIWRAWAATWPRAPTSARRSRRRRYWRTLLDHSLSGSDGPASSADKPRKSGRSSTAVVRFRYACCRSARSHNRVRRMARRLARSSTCVCRESVIHPIDAAAVPGPRHELAN